MDTVAQSPFFPVPVRWFELPMTTTARWGFARLQETTDSGQKTYSQSEQETGESTGRSPPRENAEPAASHDRPKVGRILDERA